MDLELNDKISFITGGSVGIGLAVAEKLAGEGVNVTICARNIERVQTEADRIQAEYNVQTLAIEADVSKADAIDKAVSQIIKEFGGDDILINNAGTGSNETIMDAPDSKWQYYWVSGGT